MKIRKRKAIHPEKPKRQRTKSPVLLLSGLLLVGCAVSGTVAWLTDRTDPCVNVFTAGNVEITLTETKSDFKMIPGNTISKDPYVTVTAGSENCYLFVKVEKSDNFDTYLSCEMDSQWTKLDDADDVYYMVIDSEAQKGVAYNILGAGNKTYDSVEYTWADDQVLVNPTVSKEMMDDITGGDAAPTLTFTAYAVQLYKSDTQRFTAAEAWSLASGLSAANP